MSATLAPMLRVSRTAATSIAVAIGFSRALAAPAVAAPGVCAVIAKNDVARLSGWQIANVEKRVYHSHGATGRMCTFDSNEGQIVVVMPDIGAPFPGQELAAAATYDRHTRVGDQDVKLSNGVGYFAIGRQGVAIRVLPNDHPASYAEVEPYVRIAIARAARHAR